MKTSILLLTLMIVSFSRLADAQGNLVVNGGFDSDASHWTATNISGSGYLATGGNPGGFFGLVNVSAAPIPTISQQINDLSPGTLYLVSGDYKSGGKGVANNSFGVAFNGVYVFLASSPTDYDWHTFSFEYAATSSSELLSISSHVRNTDYDYYIDNIAMYPVPEPHAWILCLAGILFICWRKKRADKSPRPILFPR